MRQFQDGKLPVKLGDMESPMPAVEFVTGVTDLMLLAHPVRTTNHLLPHRDPGATPPATFDAPAAALRSVPVVVAAPDLGGEHHRFLRDAETMRDVADGLRRWGSDPAPQSR